MSVLTALARIEAAQAGRAQPIADVRHVHLSDRPLVMVPLRLAGEAAAPLAVLTGTAADDVEFLIVPQPRDRVLRLRFIAQLADRVLPYISSFADESDSFELVPIKSRGGTEQQADEDAPQEWKRYNDAPQLLVPNTGGVEFLRLLGRAVRFQPIEGPNAVPESVPLLGRWLTWFADRAEHPGSSALLPLTTALAMHWATGQSALEDANLAALLGWIAPPDGLTGPQAAARAEDPLRCPPAGPATDPGFDNEELAPLIAAYDKAAGDEAKTVAVHRLESALRAQLEPTWQLMWQGIDLLRALPEGGSVARRWLNDRSAFSRFTADIPEGFPQARRDSAVPAVRRLLDRERALDVFEAERAFDDPRVMIERRLAGEAFRGEVVDSEPDRIDTSGSRRKLRPHIRVHTDDPFRASLDETVFSVDRVKQKGEVVAIEGDSFVLELEGGMGRALTAPPGSVPEVGEVVSFARFSPASFNAPAKLPAREETPWTHGGPPPEYVPIADEPAEEWS
ncbi:hypothetical protein IU421_21110 [Nocardia cyriacigeorgica]|uniref:hypothetical protein n=1 Tax=Nocardia cyriacigeorgica TaxID=135487 RepID=UPI00189542CF|nr:hypothetical protein [Nocardia cyriacigeorgica]MBF6516760.1 hypothetical protein [Nocardia cyriacigeorgica]